ncbi:hypothetical protein, partial [Streptococcus agalactiae]|uniref:hypothetical protein n=1 Tax=Streptococcus agalactiae TaxID=1311 RepID=UPI003F8D3DE9
FQNLAFFELFKHSGFRAVLFRMVPKPNNNMIHHLLSFRAVLFRMVPKHLVLSVQLAYCFRAVLFRMVPKLEL